MRIHRYLLILDGPGWLSSGQRRDVWVALTNDLGVQGLVQLDQSPFGGIREVQTYKLSLDLDSCVGCIETWWRSLQCTASPTQGRMFPVPKIDAAALCSCHLSTGLTHLSCVARRHLVTRLRYSR
jgi:hypothetical protein